jgi:GTP-binding protein Era
MSFRSGVVPLLGKPNVGKSTLLNALAGTKVAIVSPRPQTTRTYLTGVVTQEQAQILLVDTPGTHRPKTRLHHWMMRAVQEGMEGADVVLMVVDSSREPSEEDGIALEFVAGFPGPSLLALNKVDLIDKVRLLPLIEHYRQQHDFRDYLPVSALRGENLRLVLDRIIAHLPEGPAYYPPETFTDQPERFLAAEIIREKCVLATREEVPYAIAVVVETYEAGAKLVRIQAVIFVEREGQKGIVIGTRGERLKTIGRAAREELERLVGSKVYLELTVKVKRDWRDQDAFRELVDWRAPAALGPEFSS